MRTRSTLQNLPSSLNNNGTIVLFAIAMTFSTKLVVCSSACFGIYDSCFSFFDSLGIVKTPFTHLDKGCQNAHPNRITAKKKYFSSHIFPLASRPCYSYIAKKEKPPVKNKFDRRLFHLMSCNSDNKILFI